MNTGWAGGVEESVRDTGAGRGFEGAEALASRFSAGICVRVIGPARKFITQRVWNNSGAFE